MSKPTQGLTNQKFYPPFGFTVPLEVIPPWKMAIIRVFCKQYVKHDVTGFWMVYYKWRGRMYITEVHHD